MLNDPWLIGQWQYLQNQKNGNLKKNGKTFYYKSGGIRKFKIEKLSLSEQKIVSNLELIRLDNSTVNSLSWDLKNFNNQHCMTKKDLMQKAIILQSYLKDNGHEITIDECFECVRFRFIYVTWGNCT